MHPVGTSGASFAKVFLSTSSVFKFLALIPISFAPASAAEATATVGYQAGVASF